MRINHNFEKTNLQVALQNIYIFSGLGADSRVFKNIDFQGFNPVHIDWIEPNKNETLENYALRIAVQIKSNEPILLGLSFGGLMAIEVSKHLKTKQIILISSAKSKFEIPLIYRIFGKLNLHKLIPTKLLRSANFISYWFFGCQSKEEKSLLKQILLDTKPSFISCSIDKIVKWNNETIPKNLVHIHGTKDRILPPDLLIVSKIKEPIFIENGGHFMVLNKAKEINKHLMTFMNNS